MIIDSEAQLRAGENVVHTTRVAVRRLRSTLRVYAELFDVAQAGRLEEELRLVGRAAGRGSGPGHPASAGWTP